jgi:hypothetical protein
MKTKREIRREIIEGEKKLKEKMRICINPECKIPVEDQTFYKRSVRCKECIKIAAIKWQKNNKKRYRELNKKAQRNYILRCINKGI